MILLRALAWLWVALLPTFLVACGSDKKPRFAHTDGAAEATGDGAVPDAGTALAPEAGPPALDATLAEVDAGANQTPGNMVMGGPVDAGAPPPPPSSPKTDAAVCQGDGGACDPCASDAAACAHPLQGRYAVRTVSYARQKSVVLGQAVDIVSKGVLMSIADVSARGVVTEHLCFLEVLNEQGMFSWTPGEGLERIPDSVVPLTEEAGVWVRPQGPDRTAVAWSAANEPADCSPGTTHASGCLCALDDGLPTDSKDCRVTDPDGDSLPGLKLSIGLMRPMALTFAEEAMSLQVVAVKAVEWRIPKGARLVGQIQGSLEQSQLSVQGELAGELETIRNAACPSEYSHVELVKTDLDCAGLRRERSEDEESLGLFDLSVDRDPPPTSACPDPNCAVDSDRDGAADCEDTCPADAAKRAPGACGCGVADTDSDGDAQADCVDACATDPAKAVAGACGCGVAESDSDGDATPDCSDECDADPAKRAPGACGCGVAEGDSDGDGTADCADACAADPAKVAAGACGCGVAETNSDGDAAPDCVDACAADPAKVAAGACGCGVADTDSDADGAPDCSEECDSDPAKAAAPGRCGCGVPDADLNGDGNVDCADLCPSDPAKVAPGACGCGVADTNSDGDAQADCTDECDIDPAKTASGACGCGVADTDADGDAQPDCRDECDADPAKASAGQCGCGVADTDTDGDGTADCRDQCPSDPARTAPGSCGCGECTTTLAGTYAVRTSSYAKQRIGSEAATTSKAISYSLVTITSNADGTLRMSEQGCWATSQPNPSESGLAVYSWSKPEWFAALAPSVRTITARGDGAWVASGGAERIGWDPAGCSGGATPPSGWPSAWGATCSCGSAASSLPPYDRDTAPYDCRLTDPDADGYPGVSAYVSTSAPSSPSQDASGLFSARALAASAGSSRWTITPASDGRHWATIQDVYESVVVGCTGGGCSGLSATSPTGWACPEATNRAQFIPVTGSSDTCAEILEQRDRLFVTTQDGAWPANASCPAP